MYVFVLLYVPISGGTMTQIMKMVLRYVTRKQRNLLNEKPSNLLLLFFIHGRLVNAVSRFQHLHVFVQSGSVSRRKYLFKFSAVVGEHLWHGVRLQSTNHIGLSRNDIIIKHLVCVVKNVAFNQSVSRQSIHQSIHRSIEGQDRILIVVDRSINPFE